MGSCARRMIDAGEIFACIDSEKRVVRFLEDPEQYASPAMVQRLDTAIQQSTALAERVSAVAHAVRPSRCISVQLEVKTVPLCVHKSIRLEHCSLRRCDADRCHWRRLTCRKCT